MYIILCLTISSVSDAGINWEIERRKMSINSHKKSQIFIYVMEVTTTFVYKNDADYLKIIQNVV